MMFSVITVCLNPGNKLKKTLDSVLCQSCRDFEVIVKDGGSSDGAVEALRQMAGEGSEGASEGQGQSWQGAGEGGEGASEWQGQSRQIAIEGGEGASEGQGQSWQGAGEGGEGASEWQGQEPGCVSGRVRIFVERDRGIYDAMNQAAVHAAGDFVIFMNCGDVFADDKVLERVQESIREQERMGKDLKKLVLYGDTINGQRGVTIVSSPKITGFTCYRNIPCHQACFYARQLCVDKPYDLQYRIRADYDHFLWCFYRAGAGFVHMDFTVAVYEGGGYSESRENYKRDLEEHRQITGSYMGRGELLRYRFAMALTLAPLRRALAQSGAFAGVYHWLKGKLYRG